MLKNYRWSFQTALLLVAAVVAPISRVIIGHIRIIYNLGHTPANKLSYTTKQFLEILLFLFPLEKKESYMVPVSEMKLIFTGWKDEVGPTHILFPG